MAVNWPSASGLVTVNVTPGSTAPLVSVIRPATVPVVVRCAAASVGTHAITRPSRQAVRR
jgi:hypothetical protein